MKFALGLLLLLAPLSVLAGPFGLEMGLTEKSFSGKLKPTNEPFYFGLSAVPKPHPSFETYNLAFAPKSGLAAIVAITPVISCNAVGEQVKDTFAEVEQQLTAKYGTPTQRIDELAQGSVWRKPEEWTEALSKQERTLMVIWLKGKDGKPLPDNVQQIVLNAVGLSYKASALMLHYKFTNSDELDEVIKVQGASSL